MLQAALLVAGGGWAGQLWGISSTSPLWGPASDFLSIRAVGAPVTVLLLVMQVGPRHTLSWRASPNSSSSSSRSSSNGGREKARKLQCRQVLLWRLQLATEAAHECHVRKGE
jgi:hypothetical protein